MLEKMKQLMEVRKQADQIKKELDTVIIECRDVDGINVSITGSHQFKSIEIHPQYLSPGNKSRLEGDLLRCVNAAMKKAQQAAMQKMSGLI